MAETMHISREQGYPLVLDGEPVGIFEGVAEIDWCDGGFHVVDLLAPNDAGKLVTLWTANSPAYRKSMAHELRRRIEDGPDFEDFVKDAFEGEWVKAHRRNIGRAA